MGILIFLILNTPVKNVRVFSTRITSCEITLEIRRILSINCQTLRFSYFLFGLNFKRICSQLLRFLRILTYSYFSFALNFKRVSSQIFRFSHNLRFSYFSVVFIFKRIYSQIWRFSQNLRFSFFSFELILNRIS